MRAKKRLITCAYPDDTRAQVCEQAALTTTGATLSPWSTHLLRGVRGRNITRVMDHRRCHFSTNLSPTTHLHLILPILYIEIRSTTQGSTPSPKPQNVRNYLRRSIVVPQATPFANHTDTIKTKPTIDPAEDSSNSAHQADNNEAVVAVETPRPDTHLHHAIDPSTTTPQQTTRSRPHAPKADTQHHRDASPPPSTTFITSDKMIPIPQPWCRTRVSRAWISDHGDGGALGFHRTRGSPRTRSNRSTRST